MRISKAMKKLKSVTFLFSAVLATYSFQKCGTKPPATDTITDTNQMTTTTVTTTQTSTNTQSNTTAITTTVTSTSAAIEPRIWLASNVHRFVVGYSQTGQLAKVIDLSNTFSSGSITAIEFLNRDNLLVFADPGAAAEKIIKVNVSTGNVDGTWYVDGTNLNNVTSNKIIVDSANSRIYVHKGGTATQIESVSYNLTNNFQARVGAPFYTLATCVLTTNQYIARVVYGSTPALLLFSSGANTRINTIRNLTSTPVCTTSAPNNAYNFTTTAPSNAAAVPTGAAQTSDGKVYVRYQHASTPQVMQYDFDGNIILNGATIFSDASVLGTNTTGRELVALNDSTLIGGDWNSDSIFSISTGGTFNGLLIKDGYSIDVTSVALRPAE